MTRAAVGRDHYAYGLRLVTNHRFRFHLAADPPVDAPTLRFELVRDSPLAARWDADGPVFTTAAGTEETAGLQAFDLGEVKVLRFLDACDFFLFVGEGRRGEGRIACHLRDEDYRFAIDIWLMGTVLALWLELSGTPVLHASAVEVGAVGAGTFPSAAIGFLATSKGGKSSLAATLMRRGNRLLSDDNVALRGGQGGEWLAVPSYPQMRMWPDQAAHFLGAERAGRLERVQPSNPKLMVPVGPGGFGGFYSDAVPLRALYLPERVIGFGGVQVERLPLAEALIELVRNTFLFEVVEAFGLMQARFGAFGDLLRTVPVLRLRYREGLDQLDGVAAQIEVLSSNAAAS
ncbi:MAG TPA: hypothetical protein VF164_05205 [Trueperaceae bacterium]